ncbi:MAG: hypothetical protein ACREF4_02920 [Gammaproteobacteria bacterium]
MGTVTRVDPSTNRIVLDNGAVVYVSPSATLRSGGQRVAITPSAPATRS